VLRLFSLILFILYSQYGWSISFGDVLAGDERIELSTNDFIIENTVNLDVKIKTTLIENSIQWVRVHDVLLVPRARIAIYIQEEPELLHVIHEDQSILFQEEGKYAHTEFYVFLYNTEPIIVKYKGKTVGEINIYAKKQSKNRETHVIDYSCNRYNIDLQGMEREFVSVGCKTHAIGEIGSETPMVEILWISANYKLLDQSKPPYIAIFFTSKPVKLTLINNKGELHEVTIQANIPKRSHRLKTAYGFGPYAFTTASKQNAKQEKFEHPMVPALMAYFNFSLSNTTSIRGFDAVVWKESIFNNAGIYFANDIAEIYDKKIIITTLLGFQSLYFRFDQDTTSVNEVIFPQGIEILWKHFLGIKNYIFSYGMFLSPSRDLDYQNLWIRWGQKYFWELNYIHWGNDDLSATMWGLSIGFPFKGFF
jgi:hypothetical protein